jgi:hypothetical protein
MCRADVQESHSVHRLKVSTQLVLFFVFLKQSRRGAPCITGQRNTTRATNPRPAKSGKKNRNQSVNNIMDDQTQLALDHETSLLCVLCYFGENGASLLHECPPQTPRRMSALSTNRPPKQPFFFFGDLSPEFLNFFPQKRESSVIFVNF